jgi:hypothetical protein
VNLALERAVVRLAGIAMFVLAVTFAIRTGAPRHVPGWALRSNLIYLLELVLATVAALYALVSVAIHTIVRGAIPTSISKEGFTWEQEVMRVADEAFTGVQEQLKSFETDLSDLAEQIARLQSLG